MLRIGLVGLGEVAQVVHLPVLQSLPHLFEVHAACDISTTLLQVIGARFDIPNRYDNVISMLDAGGLDAVLVLNSDEYHAECVIAALERDVHVLVEKPMCLNAREAEEIIAARDRSGRTVMVGYMRRFAPAFTEAVKLLSSLGRINFARVHDVIGQNKLIIDQVAEVVRPKDFPSDAMARRRARGRVVVQEAIGDVPRRWRWPTGCFAGSAAMTYQPCASCSAAPRGWRPRGCGETDASSPRCWTTTTSWSPTRRGSTSKSASTPTSRCTARPPCCGSSTTLLYIRHLPTTLVTEESRGDAFLTAVHRPHLKDPYTHELEYFHQIVQDVTAPKTTPEDFVHDLDLFVELIQVIGRDGR